jgi:uncharacterized protein YcfL
VKKYLLLLLIVPLACVGCSAQKEYVKADSITYDAIAPEYGVYVDADTKLDADQKARRKRLIESWALRIRENK